MPALRDARPRAEPLGTQPSSAAEARTRSLVAAEKPVLSDMTRDTVAVDTPLR